MPFLTIKSNASQPTDVLIKDWGIVVPSNGGSVDFDEPDALREASDSDDLRYWVTDGAFGVGSSTLILNDGSSDVTEAAAEAFLNSLSLSTTGPYSVPVRDGAGNETVAWPTHAASHLNGGSDQIAGQSLAVTQAVSNYTPTASTLSGHLLGIDAKLAVPPQYVTVAPSGADFTSIADALASITDAAVTKPYQIRVFPGTYTESPFTMKSWVSVEGSGELGIEVVIQTDDDAAHFITMAPGATLARVSVVGPSGVGYAAINHTSESSIPAFLKHILIRKGYYGLWCHPAAARGVIHAFYVSNQYVGFATENFFRCTDYGNITAIGCSFMDGPSASVTTGYYCDGTQAEMTLDLCHFRNAGSTYGLHAGNGSYVRLMSCAFSRGTTAIHIANTGSGTEVNAIGTVIRDTFTTDIHVESASSIVKFQGAANKGKLNINALSTFTAVFSDATSGEQGQVVLGELWLGTASAAVPTGAYLRATASTGWVSGGAVTADGAMTVQVTAGVGFVNTGTGVVQVTWDLTTGLTLAAGLNWIYVTDAGVVSVTGPAEPSEELNIFLAVVHTDGSEIAANSKYVINVAQPTAKRHEYIEDVHGNLWVQGLATTEIPSTLTFDVDSGAFFAADTEKMPTAFAGATDTFVYWYSDGAGGWTFTTGSTALDPDNYDDGSGTLASVGAGLFTKQFLLVTDGDDGTVHHVVYGTATYSDLNTCQVGTLPLTPYILQTRALPLASFNMEQGSTDITTTGSIQDERPTVGSGSGSTSGSVTDHGSLTGLADDDHLQYLLTNGTRSMGGALNMGTFAITNVGNVDGRDVSADGTAQDNHIASTSNPHATSLANIGSGTLANLNAAVTDATLDTNTASRPPNGAASGQLGGTYPSPDVRGIRETAGPTNLTIVDIHDGDLLVRVGTTVQGKTLAELGVGSAISATMYRAISASTGGTSFVDAFAGSSITVPETGTYFVVFESEGRGSSSSTSTQIGVSINSTTTPEADSIRRYDSSSTNDVCTMISTHWVTVTAGDLIRGLLSNPAGGTSYLDRRRLTITKGAL